MDDPLMYLVLHLLYNLCELNKLRKANHLLILCTFTPSLMNGPNFFCHLSFDIFSIRSFSVTTLSASLSSENL
jgi:hypothetical protein